MVASGAGAAADGLGLVARPRGEEGKGFGI